MALKGAFEPELELALAPGHFDASIRNEARTEWTASCAVLAETSNRIESKQNPSRIQVESKWNAERRLSWMRLETAII
jgi:hypothetical protein